MSAVRALLSSATDMAHWANLLVSGELVSSSLLEEAWTPAPLPDGAQAALEIAPDTGIFIILLSNGFHLPSTGKLIDEMMIVMRTGESAA